METWLLEACGDNMLIHPQLSRGAHARKEAHPFLEESFGKSTRTTNDHLLVLFVVFYFQFLYFVCIFLYFLACLTDLFLFFAGTFEYFHPWSWLQNLRLGVLDWVFCKLGKFSVPFLYFVCIIYPFYFYLLIIVFWHWGLIGSYLYIFLYQFRSSFLS